MIHGGMNVGDIGNMNCCMTMTGGCMMRPVKRGRQLIRLRQRHRITFSIVLPCGTLVDDDIRISHSVVAIVIVHCFVATTCECQRIAPTNMAAQPSNLGCEKRADGTRPPRCSMHVCKLASYGGVHVSSV